MDCNTAMPVNLAWVMTFGQMKQNQSLVSSGGFSTCKNVLELRGIVLIFKSMRISF